jgi:hypothetical protein
MLVHCGSAARPPSFVNIFRPCEQNSVSRVLLNAWVVWMYLRLWLKRERSGAGIRN